MAIADHPFAPEDIQSYADGELPADEARRVETHVAVCESCTGVLDDLRRVSGRMSEWQVDVPASFVAPRVPVAAQRWWLRREWQLAAVLVLSVGVVTAMRWSGATTVQSVLTLDGVRSERLYPMISAGEANTANGGGSAPLPQPPLERAARSVPAPLLDRENESLSLDWSEGQGQSQGQGGQGQGPGQSSPEAARQPAAQASGQAMVARTAYLRLVASDFAGVRPLLERTVDQFGGFLGRLDAVGTDREPRRLNATVRVPSDRLAAALAAFRTLGNVASESQGGEDVTEQATDLDARLANARETEKRLVQVLQQRTGRVGEVLQVEREIARVREEIEQMTAQRENLRRRVSYATITLEVTEATKPALDLGPVSVPRRLRNALIEGMTDASALAIGTVALLVRVAPTLVLLALVGAWPVIAMMRRMRESGS